MLSLATIANYWIFCCEAVRSAILATAWLLVDMKCMQTHVLWFVYIKHGVLRGKYRLSEIILEVQWTGWDRPREWGGLCISKKIPF